MENDKTRSVLINGVPESVHEVLRIRAAKQDTSVTSVILGILDEATKDKREGVKPC